MKNIVIAVLVVMANSPILGATAHWTGIRTMDYWVDTSDQVATITTIIGGVRADDGVGATAEGMIFTRTGDDGTYIKAYDYSHTAAPVNTRWLLALYGDILDASTITLLKDVELSGTYTYGTGGDRIADPTDFYLVFVAENWNDYVSHAENPHRWYGWVNLAVNVDGALDVLGSDIAVYGDTLIVGGGTTPEPSSVLLLLLGLGVLGLFRPCSMPRATSLPRASCQMPETQRAQPCLDEQTLRSDRACREAGMRREV